MLTLRIINTAIAAGLLALSIGHAFANTSDETLPPQVTDFQSLRDLKVMKPVGPDQIDLVIRWRAPDPLADQLTVADKVQREIARYTAISGTVGVKYPWKGTTASGYIDVTREVQLGDTNRFCREYELVTQIGQTINIDRAQACQQRDGSWQGISD